MLASGRCSSSARHVPTTNLAPHSACTSTRPDTPSASASPEPIEGTGATGAAAEPRSEDAGVRRQAELAAEMRVQHPRTCRDLTGSDHPDQARHRLPLVD